MLTEIMNEKYKALNISRKVQDSQLRAVQILNTCKCDSLIILLSQVVFGREKSREHLQKTDGSISLPF